MFPFDLLEKFIAPEFLVLSFIFGYILFFLIFYSKESDSFWNNISYLERFLWGFLLGFAVVLILFSWVKGISQILELLGIGCISYNDYLWHIFSILFLFTIVSFIKRNQSDKNEFSAYLHELCFYILCMLFPILLFLVILTSIQINESQRYYVEYAGIPYLVYAAFILTIAFFLFLFSSKKSSEIARIKFKYRFRNRSFLIKWCVCVVLTFLFISVVYGFFLFPSVNRERHLYEIEIEMSANINERATILPHYRYTPLYFIDENITITPKMINWLNIPTDMEKIIEYYDFNDTQGISNIGIQNNNLSIGMKRFGQTTTFSIRGRKRGEGYELPREEAIFPIVKDNYSINLTLLNASITPEGLTAVLEFYVSKNITPKFEVKIEVQYRSDYLDCNCSGIDIDDDYTSFSKDDVLQAIHFDTQLPSSQNGTYYVASSSKFRISCIKR